MATSSRQIGFAALAGVLFLALFLTGGATIALMGLSAAIGLMLALSWGNTNVSTNQAVTGTSNATDSERLHAAAPMAMRPNAERNSHETL